MKAITIPKSAIGKDDIVILPRKQYEELVARAVPEIVMSVSERRAVKKSDKELKQGRYVGLNKLRDDLGSPRT